MVTRSVPGILSDPGAQVQVPLERIHEQQGAGGDDSGELIDGSRVLLRTARTCARSKHKKPAAHPGTAGSFIKPLAR
jgi:hypothetical protein